MLRELLDDEEKETTVDETKKETEVDETTATKVDETKEMKVDVANGQIRDDSTQEKWGGHAKGVEEEEHSTLHPAEPKTPPAHEQNQRDKPPNGSLAKTT